MSRRAWIGLLAVTLLVAGAPVLLVAHLRSGSGRSRLPERGSRVERVAALQRPAQVLFDGWGVPHVRAADGDDAWLVQGYLHARERFFQMDLARRRAEGRLAEVFGAAAVASDRNARIWRLEAIARRQAAALGPAEEDALRAYTAGVNAAVARYGRWVAPELWLLGVDPEPWRPEDSLGIALLHQLGASSAMAHELRRGVELAHLGRERAVDLWGWTPGDARAWIPPIEPPATPRRDDDAITPAWPGLASNAWAVTRERSASGRPLLANDLHADPRFPAPLYLIHLTAPVLDVAGASIPGVPGVLVGHTRDVAWGVASSGIDDQDLFVLTVDQSRSRELVDGRWQPLRTVTEPIVVRWEPEPTVLKVQLSERGPVVRTDARSMLALAWTGAEGRSAVGAFLEMAGARSVPDLVGAWRDVAGPSLSLVAADVQGRVAHELVGWMPKRRRGAGRLPAPGSDSSWAWAGLQPIPAGASSLAPRRGVLVAANQDLVSEGDLPAEAALPGEYSPPWRARRIRERLEARDAWDVDGFVALQGDVVSQRAVAFLHLLRPRLEEAGGRAAQTLLAWDGAMTAGGVAPHLYARMLLLLGASASGDDAAATGLAHPPLGAEELMRLLAGGMDEAWWDDLDTPATEDADDIVARVLSELDAERVGEPWGRVHQVSFRHPVGQVPVLSRLLGPVWSHGPFGVGGDATTVNATAWSPRHPFAAASAPCLRFVADVGSWDATVMVVPPGQSGRPFSSHSSDQLGPWLRAARVRSPFSRPAVDAAAVARLHLEMAPGSSQGAPTAADRP